VIESKKEGAGLDGAQIVRQARAMELLGRPGDDRLKDPERFEDSFGDADAQAWQAALSDRVMDIGWDRAIGGILSASAGVPDPVSRFVVDQAIEWFEEQGLGGFCGFERMQRRVTLAKAAWSLRVDDPGAKVAFDRLKAGVMRDLSALAALLRPHLPDGFDRERQPSGEKAESSNLDEGDVSVRFKRAGELGAVALWADLTGRQSSPGIGISAYEEAEGIVWPKNESAGFDIAWREAAAKLPERKRALQLRWSNCLSRVGMQGVEVAVYALRFKGDKSNWHGGGQFVRKVFVESAEEFLKHTPGAASRLDDVWSFPRPLHEHDRDRQRTEVRKPAISVRITRGIPAGTTTEEGVRVLIADIGRLAIFLA
jgi:hypothetical protein